MTFRCTLIFCCPCCRRSRKQQDIDDDKDMQGVPEEAPLAPDAMHTEGIAMDLDAIIAEEELAAQGPLAGKLLHWRCFTWYVLRGDSTMSGK